MKMNSSKKCFFFQISAVRASLHILAQIVGALVAAPVLLGLMPRPPRTPTLGPTLSAIQVK